jgi:RNA polymerase subunit RPABC4/transcription elongation factor Spt4
MNTFNEQFPGNSGSAASVEPAARGFWGNLRLIRPTAWVIAILMFFGMQALFWFVIWPQSHPDELEKLSDVGKILLPLLASTVCFVYALLIGFIYVDAKRRGMRHVMWTLLAIFIPNAIGIILYFVMRDPMPTPCPKCGRLSAQSFTFCPHCGSELMRTCRVCHKKLGPGWSNCAYCGTPVTGQVGSSVPTAIP